MSTEQPLSDIVLDVRSLTVGISSPTPVPPIIAGVSFSVRRGTTLVIAGESGSGKTMTSRAITGLFSEGSTFATVGEVVFEGETLVPGPESTIRQLRRKAIRYIFQEPQLALNPVATVRAQLRLAAPSSDVSETELTTLLTRVGIPDPAAVLQSYPHQLSAGLAQRVMFAMALLPRPRLIIADEPTASVDAPLKFQLLELLDEFKREYALTLVLVTHDLLLAKEFGDEIVLLFAGRVVERAPIPAFFERPLHPYAQELVAALFRRDRDHDPRVAGAKMALGEDGMPSASSSSLLTLGGEPSAGACRYACHCSRAQARCREEEPGIEMVEPGREVRCFFWR